MIFHQNPKEFKDAIQAASVSLGIREVFIEKDYWVCFILKNLSKSEFKDQVVFKGGTSLSKAYKAIHRFSEDVDLAIVNKGLGDNQLKKLIKSIEDNIALPPLKEVNKVGATSKGSRFRKTVWSFEKVLSGDYGSASQDLLLEINSFANPSPHKAMTIQSYLADFLQQEKMTDTIHEYELQSFDVHVLDIKRTFAEKIAAISRASFETPEDHSELKRKIRHLYDISMLLRLPEISNFISSGELAKVFALVKADDVNISDEQAVLASKDHKESPIFKSTDEVLNELSLVYQNEFATLLHSTDKPPTIAEVRKSLELIKKLI